MPIVVKGPCPGITGVASGESINLRWIELTISAIEVPPRSQRPIDPAKSVSPVSKSFPSRRRPRR